MVPRLEYRLLDEANGYPVVYYYEDLDATEISARFACDKFIKGSVIYEKTSCAIEPTVYIVYVQEATGFQVFLSSAVQPNQICSRSC